MKGISSRGVFLIIAIIIIIIVTVLIIGTKNTSKNNTNKDGVTSNTSATQNKEENFIVINGTNKLNTSKEVVADKKLGNILIQNSKIKYDEKGSLLTAKLTNDSVAKKNLKLKVEFIANDGKIISETIAIIGKIDANQSKYINAVITIDVTNAKDVSYEIIE